MAAKKRETESKKGSTPIFSMPYFRSGAYGMGPPPNPEQIQKNANNEYNPFATYQKIWDVSELRMLQAAVIDDIKKKLKVPLEHRLAYEQVINICI